MKKNKFFWSAVLAVSVALLIGYSFWMVGMMRSEISGYGYDSKGMMKWWFNGYERPSEVKGKLSEEQIADDVKKYLEDFDDTLKISDVFIYKDSDYYISVVETDTGKGALELLVNPYTGYIYPEYGPNMMWNEKYGMYYGRRNGMMRMMYGWQVNPVSDENGNGSKNVNHEQAIKAADEYVKKTEGKEFFVPGEGHEFYGYFTFHVNQGNEPVGMLSVNYYTGDIWYHTWHGRLERVVSYEEHERG